MNKSMIILSIAAILILLGVGGTVTSCLCLNNDYACSSSCVAKFNTYSTILVAGIIVGVIGIFIKRGEETQC